MKQLKINPSSQLPSDRLLSSKSVDKLGEELPKVKRLPNDINAIKSIKHLE